VLWVRLPLDDRLDHINVWLLADGDGWTLVDTGVCSEETQVLWERIFVQYVHGPLKRVICTHFHPDHVGLAGWLRQRTGAEVWMTAAELTAARAAITKPTAVQSAAVQSFHRRYSSDATAIARQDDFWQLMASMIHPLPTDVNFIDAPCITVGDHEWQVIIGRGHSPEHVCLYCERLGLLIAGDQVLPGITSNVSVDPQTPGDDPLARYLESCAVLRRLPADVWVLPSHRDVFEGLHRRVDAVVRSVERRLELIVDACRQEPIDPDRLLSVIYPGELNGLSWRLAIGEMAAYLNRLQHEGRVTPSTANDGSYRWRAAAPGA
jgi:Zn-dependent hydrolases, including glyoxylases